MSPKLDSGPVETAYRVSVVVLAVCAVLVTGLLVRREFDRAQAGGPGHPDSPPIRLVRAHYSPDSVRALGHWLGPADAAVQILEFADFQCPYCARVQPGVDRLLEEFDGDLAVVFLQFPLVQVHPEARAAALAAECASDQDRFRSYLHILYDRQPDLGRVEWAVLARDAGVPRVGDFEECVASERHVRAVESQFRLGRRLGVRATPTFVLGDTLLSGTGAVAMLRKMVRAKLKDADGGT